ncbi:MAG: hypothetical protein KDA89_22485 [Planctomycetaceae bacterium]|nr:hypothetical protein [Planctomycetaceae bacterium]
MSDVETTEDDNFSLADVFIGDGRPLISFCGLCLILAGIFAVFQSITGQFLPHDVAYLQMQPDELCGINEGRIVHFMIHDRVSFGGSIAAIGILYLWMSAFPLRRKSSWAWWALAASGVSGFGSFLTYLGYGYLDTWHGTATLMLLPCFVTGMWLQRGIRFGSGRGDGSWNGLPSQASLTDRLRPVRPILLRTRDGAGRAMILAAACGMIGGGVTIQCIGMTNVFVATDLEYMGLDRAQLNAVNPRLIPLIAHDRAGFGGAVVTAGMLTFAAVWYFEQKKSLRQALMLCGAFGWGTAILIHPAIGYTDPIHLAPAVIGATLFFGGILLTGSRSLDAANDNICRQSESG